MKTYSIMALLPILLISATTTKDIVLPEKVVNQNAIITQVKLTPRELVRIKGAQYGVSVPLMERIITCESNWNTTIQSKHRYTKDRPREGVFKGQREQSFGLAMWHIPAKNKKKDGTVITKEDALNPEIAIDTMAWYISEGKASIWTCYKLPKPIKGL